MPATTNQHPTLSDINDDYDIDQSVNDFVEVASEAMVRFYVGLYALYQTFSQTMSQPETKCIFGQALRTQLIEPLSQEYPDFENFDFTVSDQGIVGQNDFTNSVLHALNKLMYTPVREKHGHDNELPDIVPSFLQMGEQGDDNGY